MLIFTKELLDRAWPSQSAMDCYTAAQIWNERYVTSQPLGTDSILMGSYAQFPAGYLRRHQVAERDHRPTRV